VKRHDVDLVSFVFALLFLVVGAIFFAGDVDVVDFIQVWALPGALLVMGLILGAVTIDRFRKRHDDDQAIDF